MPGVANYNNDYGWVLRLIATIKGDIENVFVRPQLKMSATKEGRYREGLCLGANKEGRLERVFVWPQLKRGDIERVFV